MKAPRRLLLGESASPVLVVDGATSDSARGRAIAQALAPFPPAGRNYPGVRRVIEERDEEAFAYVTALLEGLSPYLAGAFDLEGFYLVEASFSLVTTRPEALAPVQRLPHFDGVEPDLIAGLLYLSECAGTAFYRHRSSGLERIEAATVDGYVTAARRLERAAKADYIRGATVDFAEIGRVEGTLGRFAAYPGNLLHSGIIPSGQDFSADPMAGRLTLNLFMQAR